MKLNLDSGTAAYSINGLEEQAVSINGTWYQRPLIVTPEFLLHPWSAPTIANLTAEDFASVHDHADVLLLGTGARQHFPDPRLIAALAGQGIGLEVMDTAAACRTFNVLTAEGRRIAAALYLGDAA